MSLIQTIEAKLKEALKPEKINVLDDSPRYYGRDFAEEGKISHLALRIVSDKFAGQSRVARHRMVQSAIREEIAQVHAITALQTFTPEEFSKLEESE